MDCLCCANGGAGPATDSEFLGSVCNLKMDGMTATAKFPAEPDRYVLYVIAGCPFAARPWVIQSIYGLPIQTVKLFPASYDQGWFFSPTSPGEQDLVNNFPDAQYDSSDPVHPSSNENEKIHHLKQLYVKANPKFEGAVSVPLLWDKEQDQAVSNSSFGLAEMMYSQMRGMATRNQDLELFPSDPQRQREHSELLQFLHSKVTTSVYKMNATRNGKDHDRMAEEYYETLRELQKRIETNDGKWLMSGPSPTFADFVFWISLVRLDLAYQWRFGLGKYNIREDYPQLQLYINRIFEIEGVKETVLPRDLMALYFMTLKWTQNDNGRSLPLVPNTWAKTNGF
uniref:GST C-terminal domain-containing protein n=1 Tax=Entomoneis paludosa TaxID=265537 RepID=A0A7S2Y4V1_9STRA|mmetsp:Transcript_15448/g.31914  ORF Transcript_15448/g.31914 Transcript_15448/m.31914 type:complete len:340 (+) Transcript_15448:102-1121(+)